MYGGDGFTPKVDDLFLDAGVQNNQYAAGSYTPTMNMTPSQDYYGVDQSEYSVAGYNTPGYMGGFSPKPTYQTPAYMSPNPNF